MGLCWGTAAICWGTPFQNVATCWHAACYGVHSGVHKHCNFVTLGFMLRYTGGMLGYHLPIFPKNVPNVVLVICKDKKYNRTIEPHYNLRSSQKVRKNVPNVNKEKLLML